MGHKILFATFSQNIFNFFECMYELMIKKWTTTLIHFSILSIAARFDDFVLQKYHTYWRFITIFWQLLDIRNVHNLLFYFSTLKYSLGFLFAMQLYFCK